MASIEVFDDLKDVVGEDGFKYIMIGFIAIFAILLIKNSGSSENTETVAVAYSSYPDTVTNANVIISTLQDSIEYSEGEIKEDIAELGNVFAEQLGDINDNISSEFSATNNYIAEGFNAQRDLANLLASEVNANITATGEQIENAISSSNSSTDSTSSTFTPTLKTGLQQTSLKEMSWFNNWHGNVDTSGRGEIESTDHIVYVKE